MRTTETPTPLSPEELDELRAYYRPGYCAEPTVLDDVSRLLSTIDHYKALSTPVTPSLISAAQQAASILFDIAQHSHQMDDTDKDLCRSVREALDKALSTGRVGELRHPGFCEACELCGTPRVYQNGDRGSIDGCDGVDDPSGERGLIACPIRALVSP